MVDFGTPYAIDGTTIPAEGLRRQSQRDAGAGSGVARPGDLKVTQMNTPGTGVRIAAGDDIIQCRAPNRDRESYSTPNFTAQDWMGDAGTGIPGTGSSATRRDMIIHEILDPSLPRHYTPQAQWPAGALSKISVVPGVPAAAKSVKDVPALNDVTCYELAAINWPTSTATITNAMIEDLRKVHRPEIVPGQVGSTTPPSNQDLTASSFARWISTAEWTIDVPDTATFVELRFDVLNAIHMQANVYGTIGLFIDGVLAASGPYAADWAGAQTRQAVFAWGRYKIPTSKQGKPAVFDLRAFRSTATGYLRADAQTRAVLDYRFIGAAA